MNADTLRFIRSEGAGLLMETRRELWRNLTGIKAQTRISDIYASRREFLEPELFLSCGEYTGGDGEEKTRMRLLSAFLAREFLSGKSATLIDRTLTLEAGEKFRAAGERLTLRSAKARILSEPKKHKRDEIDESTGEILSGLNTLCLRKLDVLQECAEALGLADPGEMIDAVQGAPAKSLGDEAAAFLRDTDYIAGDMLGWFLVKKIEVPFGDASISDMAFLFNSAELGGYFPKPDVESFTGTVLGGISLDPPRPVIFDTARRIGKTTDGFALTLGPPMETAISVFPAGGIHDYDALLGSLGHSLCYAFTEPEDDFEFVCLRDPYLTDIFSELLRSLIYEPVWLKRYMRIDTGGDFHNFLHLRKLMKARIDAGRILCIREICGGGDAGALPDAFSDIMYGAAKCRYDGRRFLPEFFSPMRSPFLFEAVLAAPGLRLSMKEAYDEEWWRTSAAGDFLRGVWSGGGRMTGDSLLTRCGCGERGSEALVRYFEETFR